MLELARKADLLDGYLENQVFSPAVVRGKEIVWARGAALDRTALPGPRGRGAQRPAHALVLGRRRSRAAASSTT